MRIRKQNRLEFGALPTGVDTYDVLAAVGKNTGNRSDYAHVLGYRVAVEILLEALCGGSADGKHSTARAFADGLVYPLGYCIRHYVELALKAAIKDIEALRNKKAQPNSGHRLQELWPAFQSASKSDRRLSPFLKRLRPLVRAVAAVDPTGQAFRYREDLDGRVHLKQTAVIHIQSTQKLFLELRAALSELEYQIEDLGNEYFGMTFTDKLSRADLIDIARRQRAAHNPKDRGWMKVFSGSIKKRYGLSNAEFAAAADMIGKRPFLSFIAGQEKPLAELTPRTMSILMLGLLVFEDFDMFTRTEWAGLRGVLEVMRPVCGPEDYDGAVRRYRYGRKAAKSDIARDILCRPEDFLAALRRLGQPTLADAFEEAWPPSPLEDR